MPARLEHANLSVRDIDHTIRFLQTAFPEFRIRADRTDSDGSRWVHVGTDDTYIALTQAGRTPDRPWEPYAGLPGVNHLGYEVDAAAALRERMLSAGYEESTPPNHHRYRRRVYFLDPDGNDWEFVQYFSAVPAERNEYEPQLSHVAAQTAGA
jgi:catechol 2,3-dioxygenase-like lactoylglutathione lyase family enzyme